MKENKEYQKQQYQSPLIQHNVRTTIRKWMKLFKQPYESSKHKTKHGGRHGDRYKHYGEKIDQRRFRYHQRCGEQERCANIEDRQFEQEQGDQKSKYRYQKQQKSIINGDSYSKYRKNEWQSSSEQFDNFIPSMSQLQIYPMLDQTFLMMYEIQLYQVLVHFNFKAQIIKQLVYLISTNIKLSPVSQNCIYILSSKENYGRIQVTLEYWQLAQSGNCHFIDTTPYFPETKKQVVQQIDMIGFSQTQCICILEIEYRSIQIKPFYALKFLCNYMRYNKQKRNFEILTSLSLQCDNLTIHRRMRPIQVNQFYKIAFVPQQDINYEGDITIFIQNIYQQNQGAFVNQNQPKQIEYNSVFKQYVFQNKLKQSGPRFCDYVIKDMWQLHDGVFYLSLCRKFNLQKWQKYGNGVEVTQGKIDHIFQFIWYPEQNYSRPLTCIPPQSYFLTQFTHTLRPLPLSSFQGSPPIYIISLFNNIQTIQYRLQTKDAQCSSIYSYPLFVSATNKIIMYQRSSSNLQIKEIKVKEMKFERNIAIAELILGLIQVQRLQIEEDLLNMAIDLCEGPQYLQQG